MVAACLSRAAVRRAFTLIELLVVIAVVAILAGLLIPVLDDSKHLAREIQCASNLKQIYYALNVYANNHGGCLPVEPYEHNPHKTLLEAVGAYSQPGLLDAFYCPQAWYLERAAKDTTCPPKGQTDDVADTPENRATGHISYIYWSFLKNKPGWRGTPFFPRVLTLDGYAADPRIEYQKGNDKQAPHLTQPEYAERAKKTPVSRIWVMTDFYRRKSPVFPHVRKHAGGVNVLFLDGHVHLIIGRPRDNYR